MKVVKEGREVVEEGRRWRKERVKEDSVKYCECRNGGSEGRKVRQ